MWSVLWSAYLISSVRAAVQSCRVPPASPSSDDIAQFMSTSYDYIIVGGGTAGLVVASRLAEDSSVNVAVIEAGQFYRDDNTINVPGFVFQASGNPAYDWKFVSVPQAHAGNRSINVPRGKMLGGSSGINGLAWNRAAETEYDVWSDFSKSKSWSWDGLLPYFKKSTTLQEPGNNPYPGVTDADRKKAQRIIPTVNGFSGPASISHNSFYFDTVLTLVKTLNAIGIRTNLVPEGGDNLGVNNAYAAIDRKNQVRSYAATAYYCPQSGRQNLRVLTGAQATKIFLDQAKSDLHATGVQFSSGGQLHTVNATREVILAAGAVQTPQLLELSGIGNSSLLSSHNIKTLIDLPGVGENLQEHLFVLSQWELKPGHDTYDLLRNNATFAAEQLALYNTSRTGMYTVVDSTIFLERLQSVTDKDGLAQVKAAFDEDYNKGDLSPLQKMQYPIQRQWLEKDNVPHYLFAHWNRGRLTPQQNKSYATLIGGITHPMSRGTVHIASNDPLAYPDVDPRFLSAKSDEMSMLQSVKFLRRVMQQAPMADIIQVQTNPPPSAQSDEDLLQYIRNSAGGGSHLIGTAPMAPREMGGVVDSSLKVYGTANLRVVDASMTPIHYAANTQSTVYAVAEMAADLIKKGNKGRGN